MNSYVLIGPDGSRQEVDLAQLQQWASSGQLPAQAPIITPEGVQTTAGQLPDLATAMRIGSAPAMPAAPSMIPTNNPDALWGYYLGIFCMFPFLGAPLVPFAIIKARRGLKAYQANPAIHGKTHSMVGLVTGYIGLVINVGLILLIGAAMIAQLNRYGHL